MKTSLSWRSAHAWLRGYSDAKCGREFFVPDVWAEYTDDYDRGYSVGGRTKTEPALDTTGRVQCQA